MPSEPKFIAFEGGEGAGKSTLIKRLEAHLTDRGIRAVFTREPGGTGEGKRLREILLTGETASWDPMAEALLMVADRVQHIARVIKPALADNSHVISDRYAFSTLAYQGGARGVSMDFLLDLHRSACSDFWPDMTIVLDLDPEIGLARSGRRLAAAGSTENRFERFGLDFHIQVRETFRTLAAKYSSRTCVIDASRPAGEVWAAVEAVLRPVLG